MFLWQSIAMAMCQSFNCVIKRNFKKIAARSCYIRVADLPKFDISFLKTVQELLFRFINHTFLGNLFIVKQKKEFFNGFSMLTASVCESQTNSKWRTREWWETRPHGPRVFSEFRGRHLESLCRRRFWHCATFLLKTNSCKLRLRIDYFRAWHGSPCPCFIFRAGFSPLIFHNIPQ